MTAVAIEESYNMSRRSMHVKMLGPELIEILSNISTAVPVDITSQNSSCL
jgi:hypothetical protein